MANQFPGTNFHDLNLDWLLSEMKRISAEWVSVQEDWAGTQEDWDELHDYVQDYFASLNVQEEVNAAFAQYVASGDLLTAITPTVQTQAATTATTWLNDNIVQETGYVLDSTLKIAVAAAQAQSTGNNIHSIVDPYFPQNLALNTTITAGKYIGANSGNTSNSSVMSCTDYVDLNGASSIIYTRCRTTASGTGNQWGVAFYDANKTYISGVRVSYNASPSSYYFLQKMDVPQYTDDNEDLQYAKYMRLSLFTGLPVTVVVYDANKFVYGTNGYNSTLPGRVATVETTLAPIADEMPRLDKDSFPSMQDFPLNAAHRGLATNGYPQNTMVAFKDAVSKGWNCIETDVRFTSDTVPVCLHDATINGTARNLDGSAISESIAIDSITYEQALGYDFGIKFGSQFEGTKIPTLDEFVNLCNKTQVIPIIEIKNSSITTDQVTATWNVIKKYGMENRCIFLCASLGGVSPFLAINPYLPVIHTTSSGWSTDSLDPASSATYLSNPIEYMTGKNKVFEARGGTMATKAICDNFVECCHYNGIYAAKYDPTTVNANAALGATFDLVIGENYKYNDVQADIIPTQIPEE